MNKKQRALRLGATALAVFACHGTATAAAKRAVKTDAVLVIRAATLHVGTGEIIRKGMVVVEGDRLTAVGANLTIPPGATLIDLPEGAITPGLIDANAAVESHNVMTPSRPRAAGRVLHDFFCPTHHDRKVLGCCGSTCPRALQHADGKKCAECGFPNVPPNLALGTRPGFSLAEQSAEVIPHTRIIDAVDLRSPDFDRLVAGGVTTVYVSPDSAAVISSRGAIVRTGGPMADRIIAAEHAVKAVMGSEPSSRGASNGLPWREHVDFHTRRPTTRMGVTWVFRKAFYDARRHENGQVVYGADTPGDAALAVLSDVLDGRIPLRIQARMQHDILSAIRLADEFGLSFVLEEATEAHLCVDELKANGIPVIYGPIYVRSPGNRAWTETQRSRLHTMRALLRTGIETALTANDLRDEDGLARQAMYAVHYGVSLAEVTKAVTQTPARLLGLGERIGTLEIGKQADIVLWSGGPFEAASDPIVVVISGKVVLDRRDG